jgi:hypothetical protein
MSESIWNRGICPRISFVWAVVVGKRKLEGRELEGNQTEVYVYVVVGNISMVKSEFVDVGELGIVESVGVIELNCWAKVVITRTTKATRGLITVRIFIFTTLEVRN